LSYKLFFKPFPDDPKMTSFVCESWAEDSAAIYYHGFKTKGKVFSALNYCIFRESKTGELFFGKIQSIFLEKSTDTPMAEVSVFQYTPDDQKRTEIEEYNELWAVLDDTMEIPLSSIQSKEVALCYVPPTITDNHLLDYVHKNIGKKEHDEAIDSDDEEEADDLADFIVNGDVMGFYQYGVTADDVVHYAPPPQFADKYLSFQTTTENKLEHEFAYYITNNYILPQIKQFASASNPARMLDAIFTQTYHIANNAFFLEDTQIECDIEHVKRIAAFVLLLKTMLVADETPKLTDMYNFCLQFKINV